MRSAYLTIDDAPSQDFTPKVNFLSQYGIPALFFCEGRRLQEHIPAVQQAIQLGFVIGNHSFYHPHFSDLSIDECKREIDDTDKLIDDIYDSTGQKRPAKYFRFPYFDSGGDKSGKDYEAKSARPYSEWSQYEHAEKRLEIQQFLKELGYRQPAFEGINPRLVADPSLLTNVDVRSTYDQLEYWLNDPTAPRGLSNEDAILKRIDTYYPDKDRLLNRPARVDIILIHDHEKTTALFYRIIARYREKSIQFLPIP